MQVFSFIEYVLLHRVSIPRVALQWRAQDQAALVEASLFSTVIGFATSRCAQWRIMSLLAWLVTKSRSNLCSTADSKSTYLLVSRLQA